MSDSTWAPSLQQLEKDIDERDLFRIDHLWVAGVGEALAEHDDHEATHTIERLLTDRVLEAISIQVLNGVRMRQTVDALRAVRNDPRRSWWFA